MQHVYHTGILRWEVQHARRAACVVAFCCIRARQGVSEDNQIRGMVVDANEQPVAGVTIAEQWESRGGKWLARALTATTDMEGRFALMRMPSAPVPAVLIAFDSGQTRGGSAVIPKEALDEPVKVKLKPLTNVRGKIDASALRQIGKRRWASGEPTSLRAEVLFTGERQSRTVMRGEHGEQFAFALPPGKYTVIVGDMYLHSVQREVVLTGGESDVDLGTFAPKPEVLATYFGKTPPAWHITDARGVSKEVKLADFRGKAVLVEFWGSSVGHVSARACREHSSSRTDTRPIRIDSRSSLLMVPLKPNSPRLTRGSRPFRSATGKAERCPSRCFLMELEGLSRPGGLLRIPHRCSSTLTGMLWSFRTRQATSRVPLSDC